MKTNTNDVDLFHYFFKSINPECKKNLVLLHGIMGNSTCYFQMVNNESFKRRRNSFCVDVRNHGESDYHQSMNYKEMVEDVIRLMDKLYIEKFTIMGHSIGGKMAMSLSMLYPDRIDGLIILDTIPKDNWGTELSNKSVELIKKCSEYDLSNKTKHKVHEEFKDIFNSRTSETLMDNIVYDEEKKGLKWNINMNDIYRNTKNLLGFQKYGTYNGSTLVLSGENSLKFDIETYKEIFPNIEEKDFKKILMAGHHIHMERPMQVSLEIIKFIDEIDNKSNIKVNNMI